jgi:hypothetical protein
MGGNIQVLEGIKVLTEAVPNIVSLYEFNAALKR